MSSGAGTKPSTTSQGTSSYGRPLWNVTSSSDASSSQHGIDTWRRRSTDLASRTRCRYCRRRVTVLKEPHHEVTCSIALNSPDYVPRTEALCPDCLTHIKPSQPEGLCLNDFTVHRRVCPTPGKNLTSSSGRKASNRPSPESDDESWFPLPMPAGGYTPEQVLAWSKTIAKCIYCFTEVTAVTKDRHELACLEAAGFPAYLPRMKTLCPECRSFIRANKPQGLSMDDLNTHFWVCPERRVTPPPNPAPEDPPKPVSPPRGPTRLRPAFPPPPKSKPKLKVKPQPAQQPPSTRPSPESEDDAAPTSTPAPQPKPTRDPRRPDPLPRDEYVRRKAALSTKTTCDYCDEEIPMLTLTYHLAHHHEQEREQDDWPKQGLCLNCLGTVKGAGPLGTLTKWDFEDHDKVCRGHEATPPSSPKSAPRSKSPLAPAPPEVGRTKEVDYGTEAERYALFAGDPRIAQVEEYRVMCAACRTWVESKGEMPYCSLAWMEHKKACEKMKTPAASSSGRGSVSGGAEGSLGKKRKEHDMEGVEVSRSNIKVRTRASMTMAPASTSTPPANNDDRDISVANIPVVSKSPPGFIYPPEAADAPIPSTRQLTPPTPNLVQSRRTEEERISFLRRDPNAGDVEPHRVFCKMCERWIQLRKNSTYCTAPWVQHVRKCGKKHGAGEGEDEEREGSFGDEMEQDQDQEQPPYVMPTPVHAPEWPSVPQDPPHPRYIHLSPAPGQAHLDTPPPSQPYSYPPPLPPTANVYVYPVQGQAPPLVASLPPAQTRLQARQASAGPILALSSPISPTSQNPPSNIVVPPPHNYPPHGHAQMQPSASQMEVETRPPALSRRYPPVGAIYPDPPAWGPAPPTTTKTSAAAATPPPTSIRAINIKDIPKKPPGRVGRPRKNKVGSASGANGNGGLFTTQVLREDAGGRYERSGLSASVNAGLSNGAVSEKTTGVQPGMVQRMKSPTPEVLHPREGERYVTVVTPPEFSMYQYYSTSQYDEKDDSYLLYFEAPPGHPAVLPLRRSASASDRSSGQNTPQKQQKIWLVYKLKNFGDNVCPTRRRRVVVGGHAVMQGQGPAQGQPLNQPQSQVNGVQPKREEEGVVLLGRGEPEREGKVEGLPVYRSGTWPHLMDPATPTGASAPTVPSGDGKTTQGNGQDHAHSNVLMPYQGRDERDPVAPSMSSEVHKKKRKKGEEIVEGASPKRRRVSEAAGDRPDVETRRESGSDGWAEAERAKHRIMWPLPPWPPTYIEVPPPPPPPHYPAPPSGRRQHPDRPPARSNKEWRLTGPPEPPRDLESPECPPARSDKEKEWRQPWRLTGPFEPPEPLRGKDLESPECRLHYTFDCIAWLYKTQYTRGNDITLDVMEAFMNERLGRKEFSIMELKGIVTTLHERKTLKFTEEGLQLLRDKYDG